MNKTLEEKLAAFDPNSLGLATNQVFGLPCTEEEAELILLPVPWDVTVSYGGGTQHGPSAIKEASYQVDLHDPDNPGGWRRGIAMQEPSQGWSARSESLRKNAEEYISFLEDGGNPESNPDMRGIRDEINAACHELRSWVKTATASLIKNQKLVGLVGGDHSTPLGFYDALGEAFGDFGILQIDAHCDLRDAFEGFRYSHASIMWNALTVPHVSKLVQVGIRDYCAAELDVIERSKGRVRTFFDAQLKDHIFEGKTWKALCGEIIKELPKNVHISFDIDGLDPKLCPTTGTPVPGGLEFEAAVYLLREVVRSGRTVIGFDLCEVSPGETEWDANVGARMLFKLCNLLLLSNGKGR